MGNAIPVNDVFEGIIGVMVWVWLVAIISCHALQDVVKVLDLFWQLLFACLVPLGCAAPGGSGAMAKT